MTGMQTGREVPVSGKSKVQFERNNLTDFSGSQRAYDALQAHLGLGWQGNMPLKSFQQGVVCYTSARSYGTPAKRHQSKQRPSKEANVASCLSAVVYESYGFWSAVPSVCVDEGQSRS